MNRTPFTAALGVAISAALLTACSTVTLPPPALSQARGAVRSAELDPAVLNLAPLELKKATDSLARANALFNQGKPAAEVSSAAYVANVQAQTAVAIAQAKTHDTAITGMQAEREKARADAQAMAASKAQVQAGASERRAVSAEQQTAVAQASASDAQQLAAQLKLRLAELQAQQTERGMLVTLGDVLFETGRSDVKPAAQTSLHKLADFLAQYPARRVLIEGHTDNVGSSLYNEGLSLRRAEAVDTALIGMGVAGKRVATVGYGEDYPVADNATDTNRALNRRVEVYIAENDQPVRARR
ncbi:MAG TPA: OmpA family protein [Ideonella sp.]|jgi:outer membrane protein OmpA-like peptidoglycan-associated protein|nr:OmpA family protein [Ideonella sp.]